MKVSKCNLTDHAEIDIKKSITDAAKVMAKKDSRIIYVTKKKVPLGVISSLDFVNDVIAKGKSPSKTKVSQIMKYPIYAVQHDEDIVSAYFKIAKYNVVSLPVIKNNKIIGLLSSQEILKHFIKKGSKK
ncbi:cyclic nucleotide-binding/CBS domain-containing protein [Nanoarchaeota archaeon]